MRYFLLAFLLISSLSASSGSYNRGEMLFFSNACNGCHGAEAEGGGIYPRLAQKKKNYLVNKLKYFRRGRVSTQNQEMMVQFVLKFSDKNIDDIATFLSEHKGFETEPMQEDLFGGYGS